MLCSSGWVSRIDWYECEEDFQKFVTVKKTTYWEDMKGIDKCVYLMRPHAMKFQTRLGPKYVAACSSEGTCVKTVGLIVVFCNALMF